MKPEWTGEGWKGLENEFPALNRDFGGKRLVYLDNACTALKSKSAAWAAVNLLLESGACAGKRSVHLLSQEVDDVWCRSRKTVADFIGAGSDSEIIFTSGTTDAANLVAASFPYSTGRREVVIAAIEHNSVFLPFYKASREGRIRLKIIRSDNFNPDMKALKRALGRKTALVAVTHASNVFGGTVPVKEISRLSHRAGAMVFVDDAQFVATHRENAGGLGADMLAFSGHKLGAPFGIGALYIKRSLMKRFVPFKVGGGTVRDIQARGGKWKISRLDGPALFEPGIQNYSGCAGLAQAIRFLSSLGMDRIRRHMSSLIGYARERLRREPGLRIIADSENLSEGAILSILPTARNFSLVDFSIFLNHGLKKHVIAIRTGHHCAHVALNSAGIPHTIRLSFFIYNTRADVDAFADAWGAYARRMK